MVTAKYEIADIWEFLSEVKDPEIPLVSIVGMGIVRNIIFDDELLKVEITTTYSGCPAMREIEEEVKKKLKEKGIVSFDVRTILSPPWTSDWINEETREKLKQSGISPPHKVEKKDFLEIFREKKSICCPYCDSNKTQKTSEFGSTLCKSLHYCDGCHQPFEYFKCL